MTSGGLNAPSRSNGNIDWEIAYSSIWFKDVGLPLE